MPLRPFSTVVVWIGAALAAAAIVVWIALVAGWIYVTEDVWEP